MPKAAGRHQRDLDCCHCAGKSLRVKRAVGVRCHCKPLKMLVAGTSVAPTITFRFEACFARHFGRGRACSAARAGTDRTKGPSAGAIAGRSCRSGVPAQATPSRRTNLKLHSFRISLRSAAQLRCLSSCARGRPGALSLGTCLPSDARSVRVTCKPRVLGN